MRSILLSLPLVLVLTGMQPQGPDGKAIFEKKGNCSTCHGKNGTGTPLAPNLADSTWLQVDGSLEQIRKLITTGVPKPKQHPAPMPPMGGAKLNAAEIDAVAQYVHGLSAPKPAPK